jgi:2-deoxy-D-gluconate 3-dehydrogenase
MILEKFRLDEQIAIVTGGTRGIGKAIALAIAEAGANVAVVSRSPAPEIEQKISALGRQYLHYSADLTLREQTREVVPAVVDAMGDVDILVNNSGFVRRGTPEDISEKDWDKVIEINLTAPFLLSQAAGKIMLKKGKGKIINIGSIMSFQGGASAAYGASKHGLAGLTKALSNNWASKGINVNAIAPGFITTKFTSSRWKDPDFYNYVIQRTPAGRWGEAADVSGAAVFLASAASDFLNGVILPADGGWLGK